MLEPAVENSADACLYHRAEIAPLFLRRRPTNGEFSFLSWFVEARIMTVVASMDNAGACQSQASFEDDLFKAFTANSRRDYGFCLILLMVLVVSTSALMFLTGAVPQRDGAWDSVFIPGGSLAIGKGLRPHTDYFDLFGVTSSLPPLLGMCMVGCKSEALAYGPAMLLPVMAIWAWAVARRRFPALPSLLTAAFLGGLVVGAYPLGWLGWLTLGYQMQYNRFQWSIACLLVLIVFVGPRRNQTRLESAWEGVTAPACWVDSCL